MYNYSVGKTDANIFALFFSEPSQIAGLTDRWCMDIDSLFTHS